MEWCEKKRKKKENRKVRSVSLKFGILNVGIIIRKSRELIGVIESIPRGERLVLGVDLNGHVGERKTSVQEVMGRFGIEDNNLEGQAVVDFAKRKEMVVVNTYFQKTEEHRVTYKSGGRSTQIDPMQNRSFEGD